MDFKEIRKCFGTFSVDARDMATNPDFWAKILSHVLVTRCEHRFWRDVFVYDGFSILFQPVREGEEPLFYKFDMDEFNDIIAVQTEEMEITRCQKRDFRR
jgi:hypothetical protein